LPGSANYFCQGWVTYAETAKIQQLGVTPETITQFGIVSEAVAKAMALGAQKRAGATIGVGITGLAGPTGETPQTPVGTVCISLANGTQTESRTFHFPGDREMVRDRAAKIALIWLRFAIEGRRLPF
jgi:PncC family amidohydrolase